MTNKPRLALSLSIIGGVLIFFVAWRDLAPTACAFEIADSFWDSLPVQMFEYYFVTFGRMFFVFLVILGSVLLYRGSKHIKAWSIFIILLFLSSFFHGRDCNETYLNIIGAILGVIGGLLFFRLRNKSVFH